MSKEDGVIRLQLITQNRHQEPRSEDILDIILNNKTSSTALVAKIEKNVQESIDTTIMVSIEDGTTRSYYIDHTTIRNCLVGQLPDIMDTGAILLFTTYNQLKMAMKEYGVK